MLPQAWISHICVLVILWERSSWHMLGTKTCVHGYCLGGVLGTGEGWWDSRGPSLQIDRGLGSHLGVRGMLLDTLLQHTAFWLFGETGQLSPVLQSGRLQSCLFHLEVVSGLCRSTQQGELLTLFQAVLVEGGGAGRCF